MSFPLNTAEINLKVVFDEMDKDDLPFLDEIQEAVEELIEFVQSDPILSAGVFYVNIEIGGQGAE